MADMKTITINGVQYAVKDINAVRFNEDQNLTEEQKAKAQKNMGVVSTIYIGPEAPTDENVVLWLDTSEDADNSLPNADEVSY